MKSYYEFIKENDIFDYLDSLTFKGTKIYRGISEGEYESYKRNGKLGHFYSENEDFALDYSDDYIVKGILKTDDVFNSHDPRNIKILYDRGFILTDRYEDVDYLTYDDYIESGSDSNTWDVIENSSGVLDYITSNYEACYISEEGVGNFYIENIDDIEILSIDPS